MKEMPKMFEVLGMLQMSLRALESMSKGKNDLERNALDMIRDCVHIISEKVIEDLSISTTRIPTNYQQGVV